MLKFRDNSKAKINGEYSPPENIQFDRRMVYQRYTEMKNARQDAGGDNLEEKWDKWEKQYEAWRPPKNPDDWQSNIVPPFTTTIVERALAEIIDQTVQPKVVARGKEDKPKAKLMNYIKDYTWEIGDGDLQLYSAIKQALILGKTIWQEDYWIDKRQVRVLKKFDVEKSEEEYVEKEVHDFNDVYGEFVSLWDFFLDPMARTINTGRHKANDCIRRYIMNLDTFQETFKGSMWDQFGAVKYVKPGGDLNYWQFYSPPEGIDKDSQVEVLFYWGRRPDKLIIVANDVVIRDAPNPYNHKQLPFAEGSDVPRLNQFYAKGEPALLESIQDELTTLRRMRIDRQHMDLWKMFLVSNRETLDDDDAIIAPSRFLSVDDPNNSIKALEYRDINPSAYKEEELLKQDGRQVTGVESPQASGTATEAAIFKEATMRALRLKIWLLSRELLTNIIRLRVPNIVQYYSAPKVEDIVGEGRVSQYRTIMTMDTSLDWSENRGLVEEKEKGENFFQVLPEMITPRYGSFDYKLSAEPTFPISKPLLQQKTNDLMQHPIIQAAVETGHYELGKIADKMMDVNEYDPDELKSQQDQTGKTKVDPESLLELANRENSAIVIGKKMEPTANAPRFHTDVHLAFIDSEKFRNAARQDQEVVANMMYHTQGEEQAQTIRQQGMEQKGAQGGQMGGGTPNSGGSVAQGIQGGEAKAAQPGKILGNELPEGIA